MTHHLPQPLHRRGGFALVGVLALAILTLTTFTAQAQSYNTSDIALINSIIANNGLTWTPAPTDGSTVPADWTGVTWSSASTNKRITALNLQSKLMIGSLNLSALTELTSFDAHDNYLTGVNVSGNTALTSLNVSANQLTELDLSAIPATSGNINCDNQKPTITLYQLATGKYVRTIALNNPTTLAAGLSYSGGKLIANDSTTVKTSPFAVETGKSGKSLSGTLTLNYSEPIYNAGDIAVINSMIDNHSLMWSKMEDGATACPWDEIKIQWSSDATNKRIIVIRIADAGLTGDLDLTDLTALTYIDFDDNELTGINVSGLTELTLLSLYNNQLSKVDVSGCTAIENLFLYNNKLTELDVSTNTALKWLVSSINPLTKLDLSNNTALETLFCTKNQLTELDLSAITATKVLGQTDNQIPTVRLIYNCITGKYEATIALNNPTNLAAGLSYSGGKLIADDSTTVKTSPFAVETGKADRLLEGTFTLLYSGPPFYPPDVAAINAIIATNGLPWTVASPVDGMSVPGDWDVGGSSLAANGIVWSGDATNRRVVKLTICDLTALNGTVDLSALTELETLVCNKNPNLTAINVSANPALKRIEIQTCNLSALDLSAATALTYLECSYNKITDLDLTKNTALTKIVATSNQLTSVNITANTALTSLMLQSNQLAALDVTKNTALTELYLHYNLLTSIDLSKNTALTFLALLYNRLAALDVTKNTALTALYVSYNRLTSLDLSKNTALSAFLGTAQTPDTVTLTWDGVAGKYSCTIALNTPTGLASGLAYADGELSSDDKTNSETAFTVETKRSGMTLSGTLPITYSGPSDTTRPTVVSVSPADGAVNITASGNVVVTFDGAMDTGTAGTVVIRKADNTPVATLTTGSWSDSDKTLTLPYSGLSYSESYKITVSGYKDVAGNLMNVSAAYTFATISMIFAATLSRTPSTPTVSVGTSVAFTSTMGSAPPTTTFVRSWSFGGDAYPSSAGDVPSISTAWYGTGTKTATLKIACKLGDTVIADTTLTMTLTTTAVVSTSNGKTAQLYGGAQQTGTSASPIPVYHTDTLTYSIAYNNLSPINDTVVIRDTLPQGFAPISGQPVYSWNATTRELTWRLTGTMGASGSVSYSVIPPANSDGALYVNRAKVLYDSGARTELTNSTYHVGRMFTVTFSASTGGTIANGTAQTLDYRDSVRAGVTPVPDAGYSFAGWSHDAYTDRKGATVAAQSGMQNIKLLALGSFNLKANFNLITYNITYTLNGAVDPGNPTTYNVTSSPITLVNPAKKGYKFTGWTGTGVSGAQTVTIPTGSTGDRSYTAGFDRNEYTITYVWNNGAPNSNPTSYNVETGVITLTDPVRNGYTLSHWTFTKSEAVSGEGAGDPISNGKVIPAGMTGNITATAVWTLNTYTITYLPPDNNAATQVAPSPANPTSYTVEDGVITLNAPTNEPGLSFGGWDIESDVAGIGPWHGANTITPSSAATYGNLKAKPLWTPINYGIAYDYNGGTSGGINPTGYNIGNLPLTISNNPTRNAYTFNGWNITGGSNTANNVYAVPSPMTGDLLLTAQWTTINYTITWNMSGGETNPNAAMTGYTIPDNSVALAAATKTGYTFKGWNIAYTAASATVVFAKVNEIPAHTYGDLTITPVFESITYKIEIDYMGGTPATPPNPTSYDVTTATITLTTPTRNAYDFAGWTMTNSDGLTLTGGVIPTGSHGDVKAVANWTAKVFTITYKDPSFNPIAGLTPTTYTVEQTVNLPQPTPPAGKVFVGWRGDNGSVYQTNVVIPTGSTGDKSYIAHWNFNFSDAPYSLPDTITAESVSAAPVTLPTGNDGLSYKWILPDGSTGTGSSLLATLSGKYYLQTNYGSMVTTDSIVVLYAFDAAFAIKDITTAPPKVGFPQVITVEINPLIKPYTNFVWSAPGGAMTVSGDSLEVVYPAEGLKTVSLTAIVTYKGTAYTKTLTLSKYIYAATLVFFVAPDGLPTNSGASWDAAINLETALAQATQGDFIWLKEGAYTPSIGNSFTLTKDGVEIYGGFTGEEVYLYERNFAEHQTILTGNGNSVMQIVSATSASRIDGIVIEGGTAENGGGIRIRNASPTIANLIIRANSATNGGGIYIESGSSPLIYNTEISGNTASKGGGMYNYIANPRIYNTTIGGNRATTTGGGVFNSGSTPEFGNSIIAGNQSGTSLMSSVKLRNLNSANVANEYSAPIYAYSMIQGSGGSTNWNANYGTDKGRNLDGADPYQTSGFADDGSMQEGDYRLRDYSAPVNAGSVSFLNVQSTRWDTPLSKVDLNAIIRGVPYDLSQSERIIDDLIDMGAYEFGGERLYPTIMRLVVLPEVKGITTDPPAGRHSIPSQSDFVFTVTALDGYDLEGLTVTTGIPIRDKEGIKITANADGTKTVKILQVTEPLTLHISGFTGYTGKSEVDKTKVWSYGNTLYISTSNPAQVRIFNMSGILFKAQNIAAGETEIQLPQGFFVIIIGERRWKVVIK